MTSRADVSARVERLAAAVRESVSSRGAKYLQAIGPRRQIVASRVYVVDELECGHQVIAKRGESDRRVCPFCARHDR